MDRLFIYNVIHIVGMMGLFTFLGSLITITQGEAQKNKYKLILIVLASISLFLVLLGGFGMLARYEMSPTKWYITIKIGIWFLMIASLVFAATKKVPRLVLYVVILFSGSAAAFLGVCGRFLG